MAMVKLKNILLAALATNCEATPPPSSYSKGPVVHDVTSDVTYRGINSNSIDTFLSIPYGKDTIIDATKPGPACPQPKGAYASPLYLSNITDVSEDCLHLNVYRPEGTGCEDRLPVMLYIHGGSFFIGSKDELTIQPEGLIARSVEMGVPVLSVNINYRLGGEFSW
jgi:carboxylesterase type B